MRRITLFATSFATAHIALAGAAALMFAAPSTAALKVGAAAPDFSTQGALAGKPFPFALSTALKKGPVVLYFYPKTFTSGCTVEAHEFAEATPDFQKADATIIGVSADTIEDITRFSSTECRNKFAVAVATPTMIKSYDAALVMVGINTGRSNRTSYAIAPDGKILAVHSALGAEGHVKNMLDAVRKYQAEHKRG